MKKALIVFALLAAVHTWPLVTSPAHLSRNDNADTLLNEWTIAWVAHQVAHDPIHLFDANIFYPEPHTLAMSEHLFAPSLLGAPLLWLGASPVLAYNLLLLAGFALTGWATYVVVTRWTADRAAGLISGSLMAFNAHSLTRLPHLQAVHVEFIPLALLALDSLIERRRVRDALLLALWFVLNGLTSIYLLVFLTVGLAAALAVRRDAWTSGGDRKAIAARLALAAAVALAALLPFLLPYYQLHVEEGLSRPLDEVAYYSAGWRDYLFTAGRLHWMIWSYRVGDATALFPGITAVCLALVAIASGLAFRDRRARICLAMGIAGFVLSFGPAVPGYALLYRVFPLLQAVRAAARFGWLALASVALLAGFATAYLSAQWAHQSRTRRIVPAMALLLLVHVEALRAPFVFAPFARIPSSYTRLASEPDGVVIEYPIYSPAQITRNATYMLNSTGHWKPLINGYSGFIPGRYGDRARRLARFPEPEGVAALRAAGVTYAVVHSTGSDAAAQVFRDAAHAPGLKLLWEEPGIRVFRIE